MGKLGKTNFGRDKTIGVMQSPPYGTTLATFENLSLNMHQMWEHERDKEMGACSNVVGWLGSWTIAIELCKIIFQQQPSNHLTITEW